MCSLIDGCQSGSEGAGSETVSPDPEACSRAVLTQGIALRWKNFNHRISWLKAYPDWIGCPDAVPEDVSLHVAFIGGTFTTGEIMRDVPSFSYRYQAVDAPGVLGFFPGSVQMEILPPEFAAQRQVTLSLQEAHLGGFKEYVVFVQGLELDTRVEQGPDYPEDYNPAHGYCSRGIGARVGDPTVKGDSITFEAYLRFDHGPLDRPDMNRAIPHARTRGVLHYLLVGIAGGQVHHVPNSYRLIYPEQPCLFVDQALEHAGNEQRLIETSVSPALEKAMAGWTAFNFALDPDGNVNPHGGEPVGYYIREYSVDVHMLEKGVATGRAVLDIDGFASNASKFIAYYAMDNLFDAEVALVQFPSGEVTNGGLSKPFETGEITVPLSGDAR